MSISQPISPFLPCRVVLPAIAGFKFQLFRSMIVKLNTWLVCSEYSCNHFKT